MTLAPPLRREPRSKTSGVSGGIILDLPPPSYTTAPHGTAVETSGTSAQPKVESDYARELFSVLAEWWHEATDAMSSAEQKAQHRAHRRIVAMGADAVPFILEELRRRGGHWYMALAEITQTLPTIPLGFATDIRGEKEAWLQWGKSRGLIR